MSCARHLLICIAGFVLGVQPAFAQVSDPFRDARLQMVDKYIAREGVKNDRVLNSLRTVPRHEFVRPTLRQVAYIDGALPIGYRQTISPPYIVAYMTEVIDPQPTDKVLEIGTGSGYQAAVLSGLARDVYTIEIVEGLGESAAARLKRLGYQNVHCRIGDGYQGWTEHAPFDKIIVTCSPENVPRPLIEQLKEGGKMIVPLGERYQQVFYLFEKEGGELKSKKLLPTLFVPMTGISEDNRQVKPDPDRPRIVNGSFEADENADGEADNWHYQRQATLVSGGARDGERYIQFDSQEMGRLSQGLQGMALNGIKIGKLKVEVWVKYERTVRGRESWEVPALTVHYYDSIRKPLGESIVGPWLGSSDWQRFTSEVSVPVKTEEIVIRVGLNGGTGQLCVDDIRITPLPR